MQKKTCPNGHVYDPSIYGDQCPLCPAGGNSAGAGPVSGPATHLGGPQGAPAADNMHTHLAAPAPKMPARPQSDPTGPTNMRPQNAEPRPATGHTVIRHAGRPGGPNVKGPTRKLVGFLVTYNRDANGRAFNVYEGRNFIGRDPGCDICIPDDEQMSGRHLSILYRNVDDKFKFRDEQSCNGTFVNKELLDDGELQNYDIIRAGSTIFIFIAIPSIS